MQCSRAALVDQQKRCAERLGQAAATATPGEVPTAPTPMIAPALSCAMPVISAPVQPQPQQPPPQQPPQPSQQASQPPQPGDGPEWTETLRTHLALLQNEDPDSILIVRRINRLGFQSTTF